MYSNSKLARGINVLRLVVLLTICICKYAGKGVGTTTTHFQFVYISKINIILSNVEIYGVRRA